MRDIVVTMIVFGSLPFILSRPYLGIIMWSWISYMNPHRMSWGFATQMPFAMMIAVATLTGLLFSREAKRIPWERETILLLLFIGWMGVTTFFAMYPTLAVDEFTKVIKIELMTFVTMIIMTDRRRLDLLVWTIVVSLGFYGLKGGIFTLTSGGVHHVLGPPGTFIGGNNELGLALVMTVPLMRYLQLQATRLWVRHGLTVLIGTTVVAILGTQSRGALLGLAVMGIMLIWKSRRRFALLFLVLAVVPAAIQFMPEKWHSRMGTIETYQQDDSAMGRVNAWHMAFNLANDRPLVGGGYAAFTNENFTRYAPNPSDVHDAHSIYFEVLAEHGYVGLVLFILLGWLAWRSCSNVAKQAVRHGDAKWLVDLSRMVQVSLVGFAASGAFLGLAYFDFYYHLIAIVILMKRQVAGLPDSSAVVDEGAVAPRGFGQWAR